MNLYGTEDTEANAALEVWAQQFETDNGRAPTDAERLEWSVGRYINKEN